MKLLALLFIATTTVATAQDNFWNTLAEVGFQTKKDANGFDVEVPLFSKHLKTFQGKKIRVKGYIIPLAEVATNPSSCCRHCLLISVIFVALPAQKR